VVTAAQREAFERDGYVVVPGLLSPDELDRQPAGRPRQVELAWRPERVHELP
jgi:hypothetical protein